MRNMHCRRVRAKKFFAKDSFRWITSGGAKVLIGCSRKKWDAKNEHCRGGTRAHEICTR